MKPVTRLHSRVPEVTRAQKWWVPRLLGAVALSLIVIQVIISNQLATTGLHSAEVETKIQTFVSENADLRQQIASASALRTIESKAHELGFTHPVKPVYLSTDLPVALDLR